MNYFVKEKLSNNRINALSKNSRSITAQVLDIKINDLCMSKSGQAVRGAQQRHFLRLVSLCTLDGQVRSRKAQPK